MDVFMASELRLVRNTGLIYPPLDPDLEGLCVWGLLVFCFGTKRH